MPFGDCFVEHSIRVTLATVTNKPQHFRSLSPVHIAIQCHVASWLHCLHHGGRGKSGEDACFSTASPELTHISYFAHTLFARINYMAEPRCKGGWEISSLAGQLLSSDNSILRVTSHLCHSNFAHNKGKYPQGCRNSLIMLKQFKP